MTLARVCCCTVLFTLMACEGPGAPGAPDKAAKTELRKKDAAEVDAKDAKSVASPHASPHDPVAGMMNPHGAPPVTAKAPVNPTDVKPSGKGRTETIDGLSLAVPEEWVRMAPSNSMRLAEFVIPGPGGEVTLVVSRFKGGGGDATANVERWKSQFTRADGSDVGDAAKVTVVDKPPLKVTLVDIEGTNIAPVTPGAQERYNEPNSRLLGLIVEGSGDPYFFKAAGSAKTMALWEPGFRAAIETMSTAPAAPAK